MLKRVTGTIFAVSIFLSQACVKKKLVNPLKVSPETVSKKPVDAEGDVNFLVGDTRKVLKLSNVEIKTFAVPGAKKEEVFLGVEWPPLDAYGSYARVSLCFKSQCISRKTARSEIVFYAYPKVWTGKTVEVKASFCKDRQLSDPEQECSEAGKINADLTQFPLSANAEKYLDLQEQEDAQLAAGFGLYDSMSEYYPKTAGHQDSELIISRETSKNILNLGPVAFAENILEMKNSDYSFPLKEAGSNQSLSLSGNQNPAYFYASDYKTLTPVLKDKFNIAWAEPGYCGKLRFAPNNGPLVDVTRTPYTKQDFLFCLSDKVPSQEEYNKILEERSRWAKVKSTTSFKTGAVLLGIGVATGFIMMLGRYSYFRAAFYGLGSVISVLDGIEKIISGDGFGDALRGFGRLLTGTMYLEMAKESARYPSDYWADIHAAYYRKSDQHAKAYAESMYDFNKKMDDITDKIHDLQLLRGQKGEDWYRSSYIELDTQRVKLLNELEVDVHSSGGNKIAAVLGGAGISMAAIGIGLMYKANKSVPKKDGSLKLTNEIPVNAANNLLKSKLSVVLKDLNRYKLATGN